MQQVEAINRVEAAVIGLGSQLVEISKPQDRIWLPPVTPPQETMSNDQMIALLKELTITSKANAEHASKSASMLQEMTIGGLDVRVEA
jgi:hypothetical protein